MLFKVLLTLIVGAVFLSAQEQRFNDKLKVALKSAEKNRTSLMVLIESKGCKWCKKLKSVTLNDATVRERLKNYIKVALDRDDPETHQYLPKIDGVPTVFFLGCDGKVRMEVLGFVKPKEFIGYIDDTEAIIRNGS